MTKSNLLKPHKLTDYEKKVLAESKRKQAAQTEKGECEKMAEGTTLDPKYTQAASELWESALNMMTYASNKLGAIYTLSSVLRIFASGRVYIEELGRQFAEAKEKHDTATLQSIIRKVEYAQDKKVLSHLWDIVAEEYGKAVVEYTDTITNDNVILSIPLPETILEQCRQRFEETREEKFHQALESAEAFLKF